LGEASSFSPLAIHQQLAKLARITGPLGVLHGCELRSVQSTTEYGVKSNTPPPITRANKVTTMMDLRRLIFKKWSGSPGRSSIELIPAPASDNGAPARLPVPHKGESVTQIIETVAIHAGIAAEIRRFRCSRPIAGRALDRR
jgi:hypothetical protein